MVAAHLDSLIQDGLIGYMIGSFGLGYGLGLLLTLFKKLTEKI